MTESPVPTELSRMREISNDLESQSSLVLAQGLGLRPATMWVSFRSFEDCLPRGCRCCVNFGSDNGNTGCHFPHSGNNNLPCLESSGSGHEPLLNQLCLAQTYAPWSALQLWARPMHAPKEQELTPQQPLECRVEGFTPPPPNQLCDWSSLSAGPDLPRRHSPGHIMVGSVN